MPENQSVCHRGTRGSLAKWRILQGPHVHVLARARAARRRRARARGWRLSSTRQRSRRASCTLHIKMKLKRFLLRYYPPGILLEYEQQGELRQKSVDLLSLTPETDVEVLVNQIVRSEPLISDHRKPQLRKLVYKLCVPPAVPTAQPRASFQASVCTVSIPTHVDGRIEKSDTAEMTQNFYLFKILRAHILPLTNCAFNKSGDRFITGS